MGLAFLLNGQLDIFILYLQNGNPCDFFRQAHKLRIHHVRTPRNLDSSTATREAHHSTCEAAHTASEIPLPHKRSTPSGLLHGFAAGVVTQFQVRLRHQLRCAVPHEIPLGGV
jgi:hypothetical protein